MVSKEFAVVERFVAPAMPDQSSTFAHDGETVT
jgi:hypothetical protein